MEWQRSILVSSKSAVRCAGGVTQELKGKVGVHQGSTLSLSLFALVMDILTDEVSLHRL